jgi:hypothetical protein
MKDEVLRSVQKFITWQKSNDSTSFDQYDFWNTKYGILAKKIYYKSSLLGIPIIAPVFAAEIICPQSRNLFSRKKRFPIADAHFILSYLNFYLYTSETCYIQKAKAIAEELLKSSVAGYSGYCWDILSIG